MLKGHTKIELTNVNTGEVEVIEKDNMVTNALAEVFKVVPWLNKSVESFCDTSTFPDNYCADILGGILLFDDKIEENVDTLYAPASVGMTGNAVYGLSNSGVNISRGSYNTNESKIDNANKTAKFVYDFSTSQANGKIACVCLTSHDGGIMGYGSASNDVTVPYTGYYSSKYVSIAKQQRAICPDSDNNANWNIIMYMDTEYMYFYRVQYVSKNRILSNSRSVFDKRYKYVDDTPNWVKVTGDVGAFGRVYMLNTDAENKKFYYYNGNKNDSCTIYEIDFINNTATPYGISSATKQIGGVYCMKVYNGFVYASKVSSSGKEIYKIELTNPTNIIKLDGKINTPNPLETSYYVNGRIYLGYNSPDYGIEVINTEKNTVTVSEYRATNSKNYMFSSQKYINFMSEECKVAQITSAYGSRNENSSTAYMYFDTAILMPNYLATINNLSSPVVKTADKTMKITYTITESEGE